SRQWAMGTRVPSGKVFPHVAIFSASHWRDAGGALLLLVRDAVELIAGANEQLAVAHRRGGAEVAVVGGEAVGRQLIKLPAERQYVRVARAADEVELAVGDDRRGIIGAADAAGPFTRGFAAGPLRRVLAGG